MAITNYPEYPAEQIEWLRNYYPTHSGKDTQKAFAEHFGLELSISQIKHRCQKYGIKRDNDGKFKKNNEPWNKGKTYDRYRLNNVPKDKLPHNIAPVGTEVNYGGFYMIKVAMPSKWITRARYVYEQTHHCKLSKEDKILHLDNDACNDNPNNLVKVSNCVMTRLCKLGLIFKDRELTRCAVTQQQLLEKIRELENG